MTHRTTRPAPRTYPATPESEPVSDEMLVVVTKSYAPGGGVTGRTLYFRRPELQRFELGDGVLTVELAASGDDGGADGSPEGAGSTRYFPLTELLEFSTEGPTADYERAFDAWTRTSFGVDAETYRTMNRASKGVATAEKLRLQIADGLGVDPDDVHFHGSFSLDDDDDDDLDDEDRTTEDD